MLPLLGPLVDWRTVLGPVTPAVQAGQNQSSSWTEAATSTPVVFARRYCLQGASIRLLVVLGRWTEAAPFSAFSIFQNSVELPKKISISSIAIVNREV